MTIVTAAGVKVSVRREIAAPVQTLLQVTEKYGYDAKAGRTWGFANRPIKDTKTPSNHSWGLAIDINSLLNAQGRQVRRTRVHHQPDHALAARLRPRRRRRPGLKTAGRLRRLAGYRVQP